MADLGALDTRFSISPVLVHASPWGSGAALPMARGEINTRAKVLPTWAGANNTQDISATLLIPTNGRVYGTLKEEGVSVAGRPVICYHRETGHYVARVFSAPDGSYEFLHLNPSDEYTIVAVDSTDTFNAVVQDRVVPEVIV